MEERNDNVTKIVNVLVKSGPLEGHKYAVKSDAPILIGRSEEANILIGYDQYCSRRHAKIYWSDNKCYVQDLESTNGTYVNGSKIQGSVELKNNDIISLGSTELVIAMADTSKNKKTNPEDDISYED